MIRSWLLVKWWAFKQLVVLKAAQLKFVADELRDEIREKDRAEAPLPPIVPEPALSMTVAPGKPKVPGRQATPLRGGLQDRIARGELKVGRR